MSPSKLFILLLVLPLILIGNSLAADPGHSASAIGPGTFETGNYTFPDSAFITNYLGINTFSPATALEVNGSASINGSTLYVDSATSRVGMGTSSPQAGLHLWTGEAAAGDQEAVRIEGNWVSNPSGPMIRFTNQHNLGTNPNAGEYNLGAIIARDDNANWGGSLYFQTAPVGTSGGANLQTRMVIRYNGNVGIGTTSPDSRLHIIGGVCVESSDSGCAQAAGALRATTLYQGANQVIDTISAGSNAVSVSGSGNSRTLDVSLDTNPGLEKTNGLSLLRSCSPNQILKWDGSAWACANDAGLTGESDTLQTVTNRGATTTNSIEIQGNLTVGTGELYVDVERNKTGVNTKKPTVELEVNGTLNATTLLEGGVNVCLSDGTNCPPGATDQNLWETIQSDSGSTTANTPTDTLTINGSTQGIDTSIAGDTLTISFDGSELQNDAIGESAINFATSCAAGNHLYISGGNLACEPDDDQPDSDAEVPDAITVSGGTLGSNTITAGSTWTQNGNLDIDTQNNILNITNGSQSISFEPGASNPTINTTGNKDLVITSSGGNVIIRIG